MDRPETLLATVLASDGLADAFRMMLADLSNAGLERLLLMGFEELKGRGIHYGLDGPYLLWDLKWGADAVGVLEIHLSNKRYTIHPTPNPGSPPYEPPSAGATGPDPDQSERV